MLNTTRQYISNKMLNKLMECILNKMFHPIKLSSNIGYALKEKETHRIEKHDKCRKFVIPYY